MKKMRKSASNVNNAVNLISGAYTLPLIDKLFSNSQRIENMDDVYFAITALVDTDRISEAFHMIRGLFGISGMEYPQEIAQLEKSEELQLFYNEDNPKGKIPKERNQEYPSVSSPLWLTWEKKYNIKFLRYSEAKEQLHSEETLRRIIVG